MIPLDSCKECVHERIEEHFLRLIRCWLYGLVDKVMERFIWHYDFNALLLACYGVHHKVFKEHLGLVGQVLIYVGRNF